MREPDRRRLRGRALGAVLVLTALAALLTVPAAWAQSAEPSSSPATSSADPAPTDPTTVDPPPPTTVDPPPPTTTAPPPTSPPTPTTAPPPATDPPSTAQPPPPPGTTGTTISFPTPHGNGGGGRGWTATSTPTHASPRAERDDPLKRWRDWSPTPGAFDTVHLDRFASRMRERGWGEGRIRRQIYAPFIVVGPATWSDSWGALRLIAGPRSHTGQDVLCTYGAPVLASESGTVTWSTGVLGGLAAYLHLPGGGFYYYAHLSATPAGLAPGSPVDPGDVIGYCGASGDASVPHVHFSHVTAGGVSVDPMDLLRGWLRAAERRLPNPPKVQRGAPAGAAPVEPVGWEEDPAPAAAVPIVAEPSSPQTEGRSPAAVAAAALEHPAAVPATALLLGVPLLGWLRRRTREPWNC